MVIYNYDSNAILDKPIENSQAETISDAFLKIHNILKSRGRNPKIYIMGNECYIGLKEYMKKYTIYFQLDLPYMHRQNAVERSIRTCKNHFISEFSTTYLDLPISE